MRNLGPATILMDVAFNSIHGKRQATVRTNGKTVTITQNEFE